MQSTSGTPIQTKTPSLLRRGRRLAAKLYHRLVVPARYHSDIRAYASFAKVRGLGHIHYGYWQASDDISAAQENLYQQVKSLIPNNLKTILDVGGGIGGASNRLVDDGYEPVCIVPDPALIADGSQKFPRVRFLEATAEGFSIARKFDAAVMIESYQYFSDKHRALANVTRHLNGAGCVIFAEEFSLVSGDSLPSERSLVSYMGSKGYTVDSRIDITKQIIPTCRYVYETTEKVAPELADAWKNNERRYLDGERQYVLLRFCQQSEAANAKAV
jgi:SAM-dependent methyltransferase